MKDLIELSEIVTKQKVAHIDIITEREHHSNKSAMLLKGIRNGKVKSDRDGMLLLYNQDNKEAFKKVKSRLRDRLYNTLFFIDANKHIQGEGPKERFNSYKMYSIIMMLINKEKHQLAFKLAQKLLIKSEKNNNLDLSLMLSYLLHDYYVLWEPNNQKAKKYLQKYLDYSLFQKQELEITETYAELARLLMTRKSTKSKFPKGFKDKLEYFSELSKQNKLFKFNYRLYASLIFYSWINRDFLEQKRQCEKAIKYLAQHKKSNPVAHITMTSYKAIAELNMKMYDQSEVTLRDILKEFNITPGKTHWLNVFNYLFLIKMIKKEYGEGAQLLSKVTSLRGYDSMSANWRQIWNIKEAYINILVKMGKISEEKLRKIPIRGFRVGKFVNDVPIYSKDKRGANIAILIAQFIYLLAENKTSMLIERIEGLNQYCHRYLRNDLTFRSNCFIKMLMKIPRLQFNPIRIRNHTKTYWEKLQSAPMEISEQAYEVEVIPYDHLWEMVLEILDNRK
jgi:hypothetical protein